MQISRHALRLKRLGIATYKEAVVYVRHDSYICKAEGFEAQSRIKITTAKERTIVATLNIIASDLLKPDEVSLSEYAWELCEAKEGEEIYLSHLESLISASYILGKIYGKELVQKEYDEIIHDVVEGRLSDIQIAAFLAASTASRLTNDEILYLTKAMLNTGNRLEWPGNLIVDKHCIGGLPGNKTTLIVVPIVSEFGLTIPKTSSRAITSAAGTADTMEVLAPVDLTLEQIKKVIAKENGCIAWGGLANLSPADDILIRIERALNLDSESQLTASILSKKIAAGSNHVLIDIPIGPKNKVSNLKQANLLKSILESTGKSLGLLVKTIFTDGAQPVGFGIGPAMEAQDVLLVLQNSPKAPQDLKERALTLAGQVLEFSPKVAPGQGYAIASEILQSGRAFKKFEAIAEAQGGLREPEVSLYQQPMLAIKTAKVIGIDNRRISRLAKLAGAPNSKTAGVYLHVKTGDKVNAHDPILTVHAESKGELDYALNYLERDRGLVHFSNAD